MNYIKYSLTAKSTVVHFSVHTFIPVLKGIERNNDIGLLFDPKCEKEKLLASRWKSILRNIKPTYKVRFNYPYLGTSDGITTSLRKVFGNSYLGIELEVNQRHVNNNIINPDMKRNILHSIRDLIEQYTP